MNNIYVEEYIIDEERDRAYEFIRMLLKALPIKSDVKKGNVEGVNVMLKYHKTKMKNEADFYIDINDEFYTAKYIHSKLNHYKTSITNKLTVFILNNKDAVEEFIMN